MNKSNASPKKQSDNYYNEENRPQYHFTPEKNWMNDPNGLVYYKGKYHLFYQHNPYGNKWGNMSWGHAVSKDLVHWEHRPVALKPDDLGAIFSGSIVVDKHNTSGLFENGSGGLIAIYTSAGETQQQSIAYSTDEGETWTKYSGNPVIPNSDIVDFRDPKVMWYEEDEKWVMTIAAGDHVRFYSSKNLIEWKLMSKFGENQGAHGGVWECPELFKLPVDGDPTNTKWVLQVDINPGSVHGGSGGQYFIGEFDGAKFVNDNPQNEVKWVDYGKDFYATQTWSNTNNRQIWIAWMNNWQYAQAIPTSPWRSAMSIPRELSLKTFSGEGVKLVQNPVKELRRIEKKPYKWQEETIKPGENILADFDSKTYEITAEFELGSASEFGFKVRKGANEETVIKYDVSEEQLIFDRTDSGEDEFSKSFAGKFTAPLDPIDNKIKLHIFVDHSSVEVFANNGEKVMTNLIFPDGSSDGLEIFSKNGNVKLTSLTINEMESVWNKE
nr:glycoside hydrolase family 32 protein [Halobacillus ihumii]